MDNSHNSKPHVHFAVEKVIGVSSDGNYQVQWAPAWVSKFHLVGCEHLIQEFLQLQYQKEVQGDTSDEANQSLMNSLEVPSHSGNPDSTYDFDPSSNSVKTEADTSYADHREPQTHNMVPTETFVDAADSSEECDSIPVQNIDDCLDDSVECFQWNTKTEDLVDTRTIDGASTSGTHQESDTVHSGSFDEHGNDNNGSIGGQSLSASSSYQPSLTRAEENVVNATYLHSIEVKNDSTSSNNKKQTCHLCNKTFKGSASLKDHLHTHVPKKGFPCPQCDAFFTNNSGLKAHLRTHDTRTPFTCEKCGKTFLHKASLREHMSVHTGVKAYHCEVCGKEFSYRSALKNHIRIHTGEKPLKCKHCSETFMTTASRKCHVKRCGTAKVR